MLNNPKPGVGSVPEYQISALPYASSSTVSSSVPSRVNFPYVTSFFTIKNSSSTSASLYVGFSANGVAGSNRFSLTAGNSFGADLRVKSLFLLSSSGSITYELVAGLTLIETRQFPTLTGSIDTSVPGFSGSFVISSGIG